MKKKYILNGKIYDAEDLNSYAQKSGLSFDDYLKESGATEHNDTNTYLLNGKEYDGNTMATFAQKSNLPYDEYLKEAGVKKKESTPSVSSGGTLPYPTSQTNTTGTSLFDNKKLNPLAVDDTPAPNFNPAINLPTAKDIVNNQRATSDNPIIKGIPSPEEVLGGKAFFDKRAKEKADKIDKAIGNTVANSLRNRGLDPTPGTPLYNKEYANYKLKTITGDAHVALDENGTPGLKRNIGTLEGLSNGWDEAMKSDKEASEFMGMTPEQRVAYLQVTGKNKPNQHPEYIGDREEGIGSFVGGAAPFLAKAGAGAAIGSLALAAAPESAGTSLSALPTAGAFIMTAPDMVNHGAQDEIIRAYQILKNQYPNTPDVELMKQADSRKWAGGGTGLVNAILFSGEGIGGKVIRNESKDLISKTINGVFKPSIKVGAITGATEGLKEAEGNLEGVKTDAQTIAKNVSKTFGDNATTTGLLTMLTHHVPALLKSTFKYALAKDVPTEEIKSTLDNNVSAGVIHPDVAEKLTKDIEDYKTALNKTAPGLTPETEASVAGLIQKRTNIENEAKDKDASAQPIYKSQIDAINNQIADIQRTGKPLEHEIDEATGEPYKKPTYDDVAKQKVEELADRISRGKRIENSEHIQVENLFPDQLEKALNKIAREEKSGNADKENPNTELSDNINKYLEKKNKETENNKIDISQPVEIQSGAVDETAPISESDLLDKAKDLVNTGVVKGYTSEPLKEAANNNPEEFKSHLKDIADQAHDENSTKGTVDTYGQPLVDIATTLFPKEKSAADVSGSVVDEKLNKEPTIQQLQELNDVHKNLAGQYLQRSNELIQQGLRGDELNNHPDLISLKEQMDKIEDYFSKPKSEKISSENNIAKPNSIVGNPLGIKNVKLTELPDRAFAVGMGKEEFEAMKTKIKKEGFTQPIIIDKKSGNVLDGQHRLLVAEFLGLKDVPAIYMDDPTREELNSKINELEKANIENQKGSIVDKGSIENKPIEKTSEQVADERAKELLAKKGVNVEPPNTEPPQVENTGIQSDETVTGVKKSITNPIRTERGLPKVDFPKSGKDTDNLQAAKQRIDNGEVNPRDLVDRILSDKGGYRNAEEVWDMQYYAHQLAAKETMLRTELHEAETPVDKAKVSGQLQQLSDEVDRQTEAAQTAGNKWGVIGNAMQPVIDAGFNPSREKAFIKDAYNGEIPKDVQDALDMITKQRDEAIAEKNRIEGLLKKKMANDALGKIKKESERTKSRNETKEKLKEEEKQLLDEIKKSIKKDLGNLHAGIPLPVETLQTLGKLAVNYFKQGALTIEALVDKMYDNLKDDIEGIEKRDIRDFIAAYEPLSIERENARLNKKADLLEDKITPPSVKTKNGKIAGVPEPVDFLKPSKESKVFRNNTEWVKANQRVANAEYKMKILKRKAFESQKNMFQKGLMWVGRLTRLSVLSGYNVLYKLAAAATVGAAGKRIPEQAIGKIYSTIFKGIAEKAPIEGGINAMSEALWYKEFFNPKKFVKNSWEILKTGSSDLSKRLGSSEYEHVPGLYLPTDLHQIIKDPVKRGTFEASFRNAMIHAEKNGLDISDPLVIQSMETAAYKRAQYEIFQEQNWLSKKLTSYKSNLEKQGNVGATAKFLVDFMIPVSTVPTNIVRRLVTTSPLGLIRGSKMVLDAYRKGIGSLSEEQADKVMMQLKQGSLGTALWLMGWFGASHYGGLYSKYNPDKKRKEGDLAHDEMEVNGQMLPKPVQHALPLEIIQFAATARHVYDNYTKKKDASDFNAIYNAAMGSIGALAEQIPIISTGAHVVGAFSDPYQAKKLQDDVKRRFEPQILRETGVISTDKKK